jgi:hypothetical protein
MVNQELTEKERVEKLKDGVSDNKHVFLLIFMDGCGPCNDTKPKWFEFEKNHQDDDNIVIVHIEQESIPEVASLIGESPGGFPCMRYLHNGKVEEYEKCEKLDKSDLRSVESFDKWLKIKAGKDHASHEKSQQGGKRKRTLKRGKKSKRGGKWSLKYKKSINCKHPKGFSQRQHCKYGRKNWKK